MFSTWPLSLTSTSFCSFWFCSDFSFFWFLLIFIFQIQVKLLPFLDIFSNFKLCTFKEIFHQVSSDDCLKNQRNFDNINEAIKKSMMQFCLMLFKIYPITNNLYISWTENCVELSIFLDIFLKNSYCRNKKHLQRCFFEKKNRKKKMNIIWRT